MALKVTRGVQSAAAKVLLYGPEGVGKTTLAAAFPGALIIDTEGGSKFLDVARVVCPDFMSVVGAMNELIRDAEGFRTIVFDSIDWAERSMIEKVAKDAGKNSIEDFGFGRGYVAVAERTGKFLALADQLVARGLNVVMVAHATVKRVSPPDQSDGFDRYELKLVKQTAPLYKEWADLMLFCTYKMRLIEGSDGKKKGFGGRERVMYAERSASYDAKNRYGLPAELPVAIESLAPVIGGAAAAAESPADSVAAALERIAVATAAQLDRLEPKVAARREAGELSERDAVEITGAIERRRAEIAGMVMA
jgi:energy-coupling factor transporter ATP-binding protein EcfA2